MLKYYEINLKLQPLLMHLSQYIEPTGGATTQKGWAGVKFLLN